MRERGRRKREEGGCWLLVASTSYQVALVTNYK